METEDGSDRQLYCRELKQRGAKLLQTGKWSDCTLLVGTTPQVSFRVHKLILSMASPVFDSLFVKGKAEKNETILIPKEQPESFGVLLNYIYSEDINISSFKMAQDLYVAANKYQLLQLVRVCSTFMCCNLTLQDVCQLYELGQWFDDTVLMEECLRIIKMDIKAVLCSKSFFDADLNTVLAIFSVPDLRIESELELFYAAEQYVQVQRQKNLKRASSTPVTDRIKRKKTETSMQVSDMDEDQIEIDGENGTPEKKYVQENNAQMPRSIKNDSETVQTIRSAIKKIRFLTLNPADFARAAVRSGLLTDEETFAVLMNMACPDSAPMPDGFSTSLELRYVPFLHRPAIPKALEASAEATFTLAVPNVDNFRRSAQSAPQQLLGRTMLIKMVPRYESTSSNNVINQYLGFYIRCEKADDPALQDRKWQCKVEFRLLARGPNTNAEEHHIKMMMDWNLTCVARGKEFDRLVSTHECRSTRHECTKGMYARRCAAASI